MAQSFIRLGKCARVAAVVAAVLSVAAHGSQTNTQLKETSTHQAARDRDDLIWSFYGDSNGNLLFTPACQTCQRGPTPGPPTCTRLVTPCPSSQGSRKVTVHSAQRGGAASTWEIDLDSIIRPNPVGGESPRWMVSVTGKSRARNHLLTTPSEDWDIVAFTQSGPTSWNVEVEAKANASTPPINFTNSCWIEVPCPKPPPPPK